MNRNITKIANQWFVISVIVVIILIILRLISIVLSIVIMPFIVLLFLFIKSDYGCRLYTQFLGLTVQFEVNAPPQIKSEKEEIKIQEDIIEVKK